MENQEEPEEVIGEVIEDVVGEFIGEVVGEVLNDELSKPVIQGYDLWRGDTDTDEVWNLREIFLRAHHGKFPDEKLICLSYCFINNELHGSVYPSSIMEQLDSLTTGLREVANFNAIQNTESIVENVDNHEQTEVDNHVDQTEVDNHDNQPEVVNHDNQSEIGEEEINRVIAGIQQEVEDPTSAAPKNFVNFRQASKSTSSSYSSLPGTKIVMPHMAFVKAKTSYRSTDIAMHSLEEDGLWNPFAGYRNANEMPHEPPPPKPIVEDTENFGSFMTTVETELRKIRSHGTVAVIESELKPIPETTEENLPKPLMDFVRSGGSYHSLGFTSDYVDFDNGPPGVAEEFVYQRPAMYRLPNDYNTNQSSSRYRHGRRGFGSRFESNRNESPGMAKKSPEERKFYELYNNLLPLRAPNNISRLQMALDKVSMVTNCNDSIKMRRGMRIYFCELLLDFVQVSIGEGLSKKLAKHNAFDIAVAKLLNGEFKITENDNNVRILQTSDVPFDKPIEEVPVAEQAQQNMQQQRPRDLRDVIKLRPSMTQVQETAVPRGIRTLKVESDRQQSQLDDNMVNESHDDTESKDKKHKHKHKHKHDHEKRKHKHHDKDKDHHKSSKKRKLSGEEKAAWGDLSNFLIVRRNSPSEDTPLSPMHILYQSSDFNKMPLSYEYIKVDDKLRCNFSINGVSVMECVGTSQADVKDMVSKEALAKLEQICYTIRVKQVIDGQEDIKLSRDEIMGNIAQQSLNDAIPESNIGSRLLKKMGWSGGGVGKEGNKGIAEPVKAGPMVIHRQGLGLSAETGITQDFTKMIEETLLNYARSDKGGDIAFSSEFTKEERALVHKHSRKLGLKSHSHGKADNRYLVVSRKRNAWETFNHIMRSGGETEKYEITEPTCKQM